jgi:hypothetical protein
VSIAFDSGYAQLVPKVPRPAPMTCSRCAAAALTTRPNCFRVVGYFDFRCHERSVSRRTP